MSSIKEIETEFKACERSERQGLYQAYAGDMRSGVQKLIKKYQAGKEITVHPVTSEQFPSKAKRPHNSRMSKDKLEANGFDRLPTWQDALNRYLKTIGVIEA